MKAGPLPSGGERATAATGSFALAWALALAAAGCGHDWSPAADAGDTPADSADAPPEDGPALDDGREPDDGADRTDDADLDTAPDADADVGDAEDAPVEDVPPPECGVDSDCFDDDPCTDDVCDRAAHRCVHTIASDDTPCGSDGICCAGACVAATDVAHCGSCANACSGGPHGEPACEDGRCALRCETGFGDCDASVPGCESEPAVDEAHCGSCTSACGDAETCWGGACQPSWRPTSTVDAPSARRQAAGLWTGSQLLVWGGHAGLDCFPTGGRYDPAADAWQTMASPPASVQGCHRFAAVWTGTHMIVWGGLAGTFDYTAEPGGGLYDPATNLWTPISLTGSDPTPRISPAAVWTGTGMIVWSGVEDLALPAATDGAVYDPLAASWTAISTSGAPPGSWSAAVVWTGTEMIVWGGWAAGTGGAVGTGGRYDPTTDLWAPVSADGAPSPRGEVDAVWTGTEMIVWGGATNGRVGMNPSGPLGDGAAYDPATDTWRPISAAGAPSARFQHALVWTGSRMIVWGGASSASEPAFGDGAMYDPASDTWTPITDVGAPTGRRGFAAVWTGEEFVVWAGSSFDIVTGRATQTNTGGRYRPR